MIRNHKWKAIISSVVILLPMVFGLIMWNQLPANMVSHWGADGVVDSTAPKAFMVFGMPLILLALQWLMLLVETALQKERPQNNKIIAMCFFIVPVISLAIHVFIYSVALEKDWDLFALIPVLIGALFIFIGNYLPKTTRNRTMGIKLPWTMGNDENWQKTHRLGGKLWFWSGLVLIAAALLPIKITVAVMFFVILVCIVIPTVYSHSIYKKHKAAGIEYEPVFNKKSDKTALWISGIAVPLILIGCTILMFTGDIKLLYSDTNFQIVASYAEDLAVRYDEVETVEYRDNFDIGAREMGFGSPRLSTGTFKNDEFGRYTLYAYTSCKSAVVLKKGDAVLVIAGKTVEETKEIYNEIAAKIK